MIKKILKNSLFLLITTASVIFFTRFIDLKQPSVAQSPVNVPTSHAEAREERIPGVDRQPCYAAARKARQPITGLENPEGRCTLNSIFHVLMPAISPCQEELAALQPDGRTSALSAYLSDLEGYETTQSTTYCLTELYEWASRTQHKSTGFDNLSLFRKFAAEWNKQVEGRDFHILHIDLDSEQVTQDSEKMVITENSSLQKDVADHMENRELRIDLSPYADDTASLKYKLVGIEQVVFYEENGEYEGHSKSFAVNSDGEWMHIDNTFTKKITAANPIEHITKDLPGINSSFIYLRVD